MNDNNPKPTTDERFGGCPHCGKTDGYVDFGEDHWFVCGEHKVRWYAGTNLFSPCDVEQQNQMDIKAKWRTASFKEVKAIYPACGPTDWSEIIRALPCPNMPLMPDAEMPF